MFPMGTVFISRNTNEADNTSPGYWNHCAIYVGGEIIVEAQEGQGVIQTPTTAYMARAYTWFTLIPVDLNIGKIAAEKANTLIGLPYRKLSSVWRRVHNISRGMNCVDAAFRIPYEYALRTSFSKIHWPDDVVTIVGIFTRQG